MRNLIDFILKYSAVFVFTFLFVISFVLLVSNGRFHSSVWFTSANALSSKLYGMSNGVSSYFNLKAVNASLQQNNALLENEVLNLRMQLARYRSLYADSVDFSGTRRFDYVLATVLNNGTRHPRNYFTIDKGYADGVESGMGVADQNGIVGIVNVAGKNTSRVISLLNTTQHISVRLKGTNTIGSLSWKVNDPNVAYMEEVPRHSTFQLGDTVVTSGYSTSFPADIPVGTVLGKVKTDNDNFYVLKVRLASDFNHLTTVRVLKDKFKNELDSLQTLDISE
ncbi:MAG: rod shape-determining protein MreC [Muribaculaceae bacterium]|nr:rod shape-determining protein MreC [Muribaculaceae bacterium]